MEPVTIQLIDKFKVQWNDDPHREMSRLQQNWKTSYERAEFFCDLAHEHDEYLRSLGHEYETGFREYLHGKYRNAIQNGNKDAAELYEKMLRKF